MADAHGHLFLHGGKFVDYDAAVSSERDILGEHRQRNGTHALLLWLWQNPSWIRSLVASHLQLDPEHVQVSFPTEWRQGGFNIVLPILVHSTAVDAMAPRTVAGESGSGTVAATSPTVVRRVVFRCPNPYRCAELSYPGSVREKMCCETASQLPRLRRIFLGLRQALAWLFRRPRPSDYLPSHLPQSLQSLQSLPPDTVLGYMVLEHLGPETGEILPLAIRAPETPALGGDDVRRQNLYRSLSRILLSIARVPQPRIGAFRFDPATSTISLTNRPVTCDMVLLENEGVPRSMAPDKTYTSVHAYIDDLLAFSDAKLRARANAAMDREDCQRQMSVLVFFRTLARLVLHEREQEAGQEQGQGQENGPFWLSLTDLNEANFLIDDQWNVTGMYDLEWMVALPADMIHLPRWMTWESIDEISGDSYEAFAAARAVFMDVFRAEEAAFRRAGGVARAGEEDDAPISTAADASWASERTWFYASLSSTNGLYRITQDRLRRVFGLEKRIGTEYWQLWAPDAAAVVEQKLRDRAAYLAELEALFHRDDCR